MEIEAGERKLPFITQPSLRIQYKQHRLKKEFIPDFIFFDQMVVEIKALDQLSGREGSQILNYLKATGFKVGVLINFGSYPKLEWKRMVYCLNFRALRFLRGY